MATLSAFPSRKERDYIATQLQQGYRSLPRGIAWVIVPLAPAVAYLVVADDARFPTPVDIAVASALLGLAVALLLYSWIPRWNERRREAIRVRATYEFRNKFEAANRDLAKMVASVDTLGNTVVARHYSLYVDRATATACCDEFTLKYLPVLFDELPPVVVSLQQSRDALFRDVEADPAAVTVYEPEVLDLLSHFEARCAAGNLLDAYHACQEVSALLAELEERQSPFDFARVIRQLKQRVQRCRDDVLADPRSEAVWRDIEHKDKILRERQRNNQALENEARQQTEAVQAAAEWAQVQAEAAERQAEAEERQADSAEESNQILRKQATALQATAVGTAVTAWQTGKTAKATKRIADHMSVDD